MPLSFQKNVTGILTNQKLMGIKFNTTGILLLQCDIFTGNSILRVCSGCWARREAEGGVQMSLIGLTTFDSHNKSRRTHSPAVRDTTDPNPAAEPSSPALVCLIRKRFPWNECSASGGKPLHFLLLHSPPALSPSERLQRLFKKVFVKTTRHRRYRLSHSD